MVKSLLNEEENLGVEGGEIMWKRYGVTLVFCVIILVSLVIFYSNAETIAEENKTLQLKTLSGDAGEVENLHVKGRVNLNRVPMMVDISSENTTYSELLTDRFMMHETVEMPYYAKMYELQQEYRSFMRGKVMIDSFYEDKTQLVYAYLPYDESAFERNFSELYIDLYDKKSKDTSHVTVSLPEELTVNDDYMEVLDVQMVNNQFIILLDVYKDEKQAIYHVTIQGGKVVESHLLLENLRENTNINSVKTLINERRMIDSDYILLMKQSWHEQSDNSTQKLYAVDLKSAQVKEVPIPDVALYGEPELFYDGKQIFYKLNNELWKMDLEDLQTNVISDELKVSYFDWMKIMDEKLYVLGTKNDNQYYQLIIFDLNQNKEIYRGEVNTKAYKDISFIELYDMVL